MFKKIDLLEAIKKNKAAIIAAAILALVVGILCIISPFAFGAVLVWVVIGLAGLFGLGAIFRFIIPRKGEKRSGVALFTGLLVVFCVAGIFLIAFLGKDIVIKGTTYSSLEVATVRLLGFISFFFGILAIINNILLLCNLGNIPHEIKGLTIARAIFGIIIGVLTVIFPFVMFSISILISGIYLVIIGIMAICVAIKFSK